ncbi:Aspartic peptidase A1 family protein [Dioscorea alata]|uniref:Aspartic peptidase A1 family protein n=1 Tax=Dioscorea alata TaxID=55571 RepID=A0ACB7UF85_DIOAL|nr:Aspartic peptidase A1 family protein [Dioscorea alata]
MKLFHRDSPRSSHYQLSATSEDRFRAMIERSISRARYISSIISGTSYSARYDDSDGYSGGGGVYTSIASSPSGAPAPAPASSNLQTKVIPNGGDYLTELEIGTPPVKIVAVADTGSDLVWVQCKPCKECYNQTDPIFDTSKSSTFNDSVSCESRICRSLLSSRCKNNQCDYDYEYGDYSYTFGTLVKDTFTFSSAASSSSIPGIVFGCSHESGGTFDPNEDGLIGLGGGPASLVSQLDNSTHGKFSHCLVPYMENTTSTLNFGDNSVVNGPGLVTMKMNRHKTFYYVRLLSVSTGNNDTVNLDQDTNIIFDSGTTLTFLPNATLTKLINDLSKTINLTRAKDPKIDLPLCYSHSANAPPYPFPNITFTFSDNIQPYDPKPVVLTPMQTFAHFSEDVICLAMVGDDGLPIFGNIAQQNLHVGYDLRTNVISVAPANCSNF